MTNHDLILKAAKRLAVATELLNQVWAIQSFQGQSLVSPVVANAEVIKLMDEFVKESTAVHALIDEFLSKVNQSQV